MHGFERGLAMEVPPAPSRKRSRIGMWLALAVAVAAVGTLAFLGWRSVQDGREDRDRRIASLSAELATAKTARAAALAKASACDDAIAAAGAALLAGEDLNKAKSGVLEQVADGTLTGTSLSAFLARADEATAELNGYVGKFLQARRTCQA